MTFGERDGGLPQVGSYNRLQLVNQDYSAGVDSEITKRVVSRKLGSLVGGRGGWIEHRVPHIKVAKHIFEEGEVGASEVSKLLQGKSPFEIQLIAEIPAIIAMEYKFIEGRQRDAGKPLPYQLGLVLSDFMEVIPEDAAVKILNAATNPKISEEIRQLYFQVSQMDLDPQSMAAEAVALLPRERRIALFEQMAAQDSRLEGRASLFFRSIATNFHVRGSSFSAAGNIRANLHGEEAERKIEEVQEDLPVIGDLIRSKVK